MHEFVEHMQAVQPLCIIYASHQPAQPLRGLPQLATQGVLVVAREPAHRVFQMQRKVHRILPDGQVAKAGHFSLSKLKGSNHCPLRTRRTWKSMVRKSRMAKPKPKKTLHALVGLSA